MKSQESDDARDVVESFYSTANEEVTNIISKMNTSQHGQQQEETLKQFKTHEEFVIFDPDESVTKWRKKDLWTL